MKPIFTLCVPLSFAVLLCSAGQSHSQEKGNKAAGQPDPVAKGVADSNNNDKLPQPPQHLAKIARLEKGDKDGIVWGEANNGLAIGIGKIETSLKSPVRPIIEVYLENRSRSPIEGLFSRSEFTLELDGKFYTETNFGGPVNVLKAGDRRGPLALSTQYYREVSSPQAGQAVNQNSPRPHLEEGQHTLRMHYENSSSKLVKLKVSFSPYPVEEAVQLISKELQNMKDSSIRSRAASAAGELHLSGCRDALIEALKDDEKRVRRSVAEALGELGDREAIEPLKKSLEDKAMNVQLQAAQSLVELGEPPEISWVEPIIKSKDKFVFQNAIWFARRQFGKKAVPMLIRCLEFDKPALDNYYNYVLVNQIAGCGGPQLKYHHDFDNKGTQEQVKHNQQVLLELKARVTGDL